MAATKASPTDLLWAYQLKREHQYLLSRIQSIEAAKAQQDERIASAESASKKSRDTDVTALAKQVETLQHGGMEKRAEALEKRVAEKLDDVQAESEAICLKLADMEKASERQIDEARKKALQSEKAIVRRVGELEIAVPKIGQRVEVIGERLDDGRVEEIGATVDGLTERLGKQDKELEAVEGRVASVEHAHTELAAVTGRLEEESVRLTTEMAQRPLQQSTIVAADVASGGSPPKDDPRPSRPSKAKKTKSEAKPRAKNKPGERERAAAKELARLAETTTALDTRSTTQPNVAGKRALRKGPGWIEAERTPSANIPPPAFMERTIEDVDSQSTTQVSTAPRKRGRPAESQKKRSFTLIDDEIEDDPQPSQSTRQTRSQLAKKPRIDYSVKNAMATAMHSNSQPKPKQPTTAATAKKATAKPVAKTAAKARGRPPEALSKPKAALTKSPVRVSQAETVIESPILQPDSPNASPLSSPSPPQPRSRPSEPATKPKLEPVLQPKKPARRVIEQADTWEEFERLCARY